MRKYQWLLSFLIVAMLPRSGFAQNFTEADREMLRALDKRLAVIEATLREFKDAVDKRFEQVDKRFEQVDKRFEQVEKRIEEGFRQVDKRFEQVEKRIDTVSSFLGILAGVFVVITVATIGFAFWDRRTFLKPIERKVLELGRVSEEDRREMQGLREEVQRLSAAYDELKAILNRANLL